MNWSNIIDHARKVHIPCSCVAGMLYFFLRVSYVQFIQTVQHHYKLNDLQFGFIKHDTESQGSCQIAFQASPVYYLIVDLVIPFNGMIV